MKIMDKILREIQTKEIFTDMDGMESSTQGGG